MKTIKSDFLSNNIRCDGDLLLPENCIKPPVVIMAHGLAAQKDFGLMAYGERFIENNMAVFLFDYRTFGISDGTPRQLVDPYRHLEDWEAAIDHVKKIKEVDNTKIALWGSSFSGGHVIATAADNADISAVIAQVPFASGLSSARLKKITDIFKSSFYGMYDIIRGTLGLSPHYSPVIARPGNFAAMNTEESYDGFMSIVSEKSNWKNEMTSRAFIKMALYSPASRAKRVKVPVLILAGKDDSLIPLKAIQNMAEKLPESELIVMDCNHFEPYTGDTFHKYIEKHVEFLILHLF